MMGLSFQELLLVGLVAVLLFGKRLPEVARSLGHSYNQFRRGLQDIQKEMHRATDISSVTKDSYAARETYYSEDDYTQPTAPRFELPAPAEGANGNGLSSSEAAGSESTVAEVGQSANAAVADGMSADASPKAD